MLYLTPVLPPLILIFPSLLYSFVKPCIAMHLDINLIFLPWYHAVLVNFQTEVVTWAEQACEDIAGPLASMVSVLNINDYLIIMEPAKEVSALLLGLFECMILR